jgi:phytoene synthase
MKQEFRDSFYAVYAFCRHTDNLIDDNDGNRKLQRALIKEWKRKFLTAHKQEYSSDPIIGPFVYTMKKYGIPLRYPLELIRGVSMDIRKRRYGTFAELRRYCYRVASVVGVMLTYVMGVSDLRQAKKHATKLGIAMQLTNILRDVGEDARMGRVYFPMDELDRFGLAIKDILSLKKTSNFIDFIKFQIARARRYYEEAMKGLSMIHKEVRLVISLAFTLYREILKVIEENGYEVYQKRAYVTLLRKLFLYLRIMIIGVPASAA